MMQMLFGNGGGKLDSLAEAANNPFDDEFKGLQPGVSSAQEDAEERTSLFLIIQRNPDDGRKVHLCDGEREVRTFLEMLIAEGADRENLEVFRGSKIPFSVSFRPVINFEA
jgi:hypothetical protein